MATETQNPYGANAVVGDAWRQGYEAGVRDVRCELLKPRREAARVHICCDHVDEPSRACCDCGARRRG